MSKKKACTQCKLFVEGDSCPSCSGNQFSDTWQGRLYINDPKKSLIAKKLGITFAGEYAIKVR